MFVVKSRVRDVSGVSEMGTFPTREKAECFMMQQVEIMKGYNLLHWVNDLDNRHNKKNPIVHHMFDRDHLTQAKYWIEKAKK